LKIKLDITAIKWIISGNLAEAARSTVWTGTVRGLIMATYGRYNNPGNKYIKENDNLVTISLDIALSLFFIVVLAFIKII
jgi:hypothetical protein